MADETERLLGRLDEGLRALRSEHEKHAESASENFREIGVAVGDLKVAIAELKVKVETERGSARLGTVGQVVHALIAAFAGFAGGHTPFPGGH